MANKRRLLNGSKEKTFWLYRDASTVGAEMKQDFLTSELTLAKHATRFKFNLSETQKEEGILGLSYGVFLLATLMDRFELKTAFTQSEQKKLIGSFAELLRHVKEQGFDVSPFANDQVNARFFGWNRNQYSFIESLTWTMSCFLYGRRMHNAGMLTFSEEMLNEMTEWVARSLGILVDNVIHKNGDLGYKEECDDYIGWGPLTGNTEVSLYFTHSVCETFGDVEDTMLGNIELQIAEDWQYIDEIEKAYQRLCEARLFKTKAPQVVTAFKQICMNVGKNTYEKYAPHLGKRFFYADGSAVENLQSPVLLNQIYAVLCVVYVNYHTRVRKQKGEDAYRDLGAALKNAIDMTYEAYVELRRRGKEHLVNREYATFSETHPNKEIGKRLSGERINVAVLETLIIKAKAMIITYVSKYPEKEIGEVLDIVEDTCSNDRWLWSEMGYDLQQTERSISAIREFYDYYEKYQKASAENDNQELRELREDYEQKYQNLMKNLEDAERNHKEQLAALKKQYAEETKKKVEGVRESYKLEGVVRDMIGTQAAEVFAEQLIGVLGRIAQHNITGSGKLSAHDQQIKDAIGGFVMSYLLAYTRSANNPGAANQHWDEHLDGISETMQKDAARFAIEWLGRVLDLNSYKRGDLDIPVLETVFDKKHVQEATSSQANTVGGNSANNNLKM